MRLRRSRRQHGVRFLSLGAGAAAALVAGCSSSGTSAGSGALDTLRESQSHLNTPAGRGEAEAARAA